MDSLGPGEEEEMALEEARRDSNQSERGSIGLSNRRGSRLQDIIQIQERRKRKARYKDKQGFTWRPFISADEVLPMPRVPHPHIELLNIPQYEQSQPCSITDQQETSSKPSSSITLPQSTLPSSPSNKPRVKPANGDVVHAPPRTLPRQKAITSSPKQQVISKTGPTMQTKSPTARQKSEQAAALRAAGISQDSETCSMKSIHSENSFQTASSDVQVNYIPRQIKDNYKAVPPGSAALERKSSVRAIQQQQYNALNAGIEGASIRQSQQTTNSRTSNKTIVK